MRGAVRIRWMLSKSRITSARQSGAAPHRSAIKPRNRWTISSRSEEVASSWVRPLGSTAVSSRAMVRSMAPGVAVHDSIRLTALGKALLVLSAAMSTTEDAQGEVRHGARAAARLRRPVGRSQPPNMTRRLKTESGVGAVHDRPTVGFRFDGTTCCASGARRPSLSCNRSPQAQIRISGFHIGATASTAALRRPRVPPHSRSPPIASSSKSAERRRWGIPMCWRRSARGESRELNRIVEINRRLPIARTDRTEAKRLAQEARLDFIWRPSRRGGQTSP